MRHAGVTTGYRMDDYLKDKPLIQHPALADHTYCKKN